MTVNMQTSRGLILPFLLGLGLLALLLVIIVLPVEAAPSVLIEQCANGDENQFSDCRQTGNHGWKNSQVNEQNGRFSEGDFMPYRQRLTGLVAGNEYCFGFGWDITQDNPGLPAVDYLGSFTQTLPNADPTFQTAFDGQVATPTLQVPLPADPVLANGWWSSPTNTFTGTIPSVRQLAVWGASSFTFGPYSWSVISVTGHVDYPDISSNALEANSIEYCLTPIGTEVLLAWGGHIAIPEEWGATKRPGGAPYHMSNGTRNGQFTSPRSSMTNISCETAGGLPCDDQNIGRNETQLQVGPVTATAITLKDFTAGGRSNMLPVASLVVAAILATTFIIVRNERRRRSEP